MRENAQKPLTALHINSQLNPFLAPDYSPVSQLAISEWFIITPIHNFLIDFGKLPRDSYVADRNFLVLHWFWISFPTNVTTFPPLFCLAQKHPEIRKEDDPHP